MIMFVFGGQFVTFPNHEHDHCYEKLCQFRNDLAE
jgi:hypothetical protein